MVLTMQFKFGKKDCRRYFFQAYSWYKLEGKKQDFLGMLYYYFQVQAYKMESLMEARE